MLRGSYLFHKKCTKYYYKCGVSYAMHEALHNDIMKGKLFQLLTSEPRCREHQLLFRQCRTKSTLYTTGESKNWKMIKRINSKIWTEKIHDNFVLVISFPWFCHVCQIPGITPVVSRMWKRWQHLAKCAGPMRSWNLQLEKKRSVATCGWFVLSAVSW